MDHREQGRKRAPVGVEPLEGRVTLSTASPTVAPIGAALVRGLTYVDLQGSAHGAVARVVGNPDVGTALMAHGSGQFQVQGAMQFSGYFHGTGLTAQGNLTGTLKLSNAKGSLTLQLQGPSAPGFTAPGSGTYTYTIQKGTGSLAHSVGSGSVDVAVTDRTIDLTFHGKPNVF